MFVKLRDLPHKHQFAAGVMLWDSFRLEVGNTVSELSTCDVLQHKLRSESVKTQIF